MRNKLRIFKFWPKGFNHIYINKNSIYQMRAQRLILIICLFLTVITLSIFWKVQYHGFIDLDDRDYIVDNIHVRSGINIENIIWAFSSSHSSNWHPLTWLSHMLDCHLYGLNPRGHHFNNLLFHIANTILLFLVLGLMTGALWRSAFVAALFALHPLQVETVAWVAERKNVLGTLFLLLTLWNYIGYVDRPGRIRQGLTIKDTGPAVRGER